MNDKLDPKAYDLTTQGSNTSLLVILGAALNGHEIERSLITHITHNQLKNGMWLLCDHPARMMWKPKDYNYRIKRPAPTPSEVMRQKLLYILQTRASEELCDEEEMEIFDNELVNEMMGAIQRVYIDPIDDIITDGTRADYPRLVDEIAAFVNKILLSK